jgi:uncharacterized spore protein YtfJ
MGLDSLGTLVKDTVDRLKSMLESDTVIGQPVTADENTTVLAINKMTVGFVTGSFDMKNQKAVKEDCSEQPISAIGGGISVTPIGFLAMTRDGANFISVNNERGDSWQDIIGTVVKKSFKK